MSDQEWRGIVRVSVDVPVTVYTHDDEDEDDARDYASEQACDELGYGLNIIDAEVNSLEPVKS